MVGGGAGSRQSCMPSYPASAGNSIKGFLGVRVVARERQGGSILFRSAGLVALLFKRAAQQVVRLKSGSLFDGIGIEIAAQQLHGERIVASCTNQSFRGIH